MAAIKSMTGSVSLPVRGKFIDFNIDISSVNGRFLEIYLKIPDTLRHLEPEFRNLIQSRLERGKVDCIISLKYNQNSDLTINNIFLDKLSEAIEVIKGKITGATINAVDILNYPGVLSQNLEIQEDLDKELLANFDKALGDLVRTREAEGAKLAQALNERLNLIEKELDKIAPMLESLTVNERERIYSKAKALCDNLDPERLEQEVVLAAQKSDIEEEYDRLRAHIDETRKVIKNGGRCGKRLDFIMQEFNREANTTASKSSNLEITKTAVELKVLIEQMREQVQNIE